jgi:thiosulfate/3-mercaptopyruvate sulfurtransferase
MCPPLEVFTHHMKRLSIRRTDEIVLYDTLGCFSSQRAFFMLRYFGLENVKILNGGIEKWKSEGGLVESGPVIDPPHVEGDYNFQIENKYHFSLKLDDMYAFAGRIVNNQDTHQIVDARAAPRFNMEADEPRPGLRRGNISGSKNLPFMETINFEQGTLKTNQEISQAFLKRNVDVNTPATFLCGSGLTACIPAFGYGLLSESGFDQISIYDASWSEYVSYF